MPTKNEIIKALKDANVEHDPSANLDVLAKLLDEHLKNNPPAAKETSGGGVVQLTCNAAGHQVGETMPADRAKELGILDSTRPFPGATTR